MGHETAVAAVQPVVSVPTAVIQPKCACGTAKEQARECDDCRKHRIQRKAAQAMPPQIPPSVSEVLDTAGAPLDDQPRRTMEARFGHDFSQVRIHTGDRASRSAREIGARAYTVGSHIVFRDGEWAPATREGQHLLAHELTHTLQQRLGSSMQRQSDSGGAGDAAEHEADAVADAVTASTLIVEDDAQNVGPGQMRKTEFLDALTVAACAAADAQLAAVGRSTEGCPYVEQFLGRARNYTASRVERGVRLYLPEGTNATSANDYIAPASRRVADSVSRWATTGEISGVPPELMAEAGAEQAGTGLLGRLFLKREHDGGADANPEAVASQLRGGSSLDGGVRGRMERAYGFDFGSVRVHDDGTAGSLAGRLGARAFTVGNDVAFAPGEYRPGTLVGEALIAHELAHVVQQSGGVRTKGGGNAGYDALEDDADRSAVGAVIAGWNDFRSGLANVSANAYPRLRSGLRLQRCQSDTPAPTAQRRAPVQTPPTTTPAPSGLSAGTVTGGVTGMRMDVTVTYSDCSDCRDGLEAVQVAWGRNGPTRVGTHRTTFPPLVHTYDSFVDGGLNSPGGAVYGGDHPYYIGRADLPASYAYTGVSPTGSVVGCAANPIDTPNSPLAYEEAYFQTVIACLNYQGTGRDRLLQGWKWGFNNFGTTPQASPIDTAAFVQITGPDAKFEETLAADYPGYSHT